MEMKPWYCAQELIALDGTPNTPQAINAIARRDGWKSRKRIGIQGKAVEYEFHSLPQFIQEKILFKIKQDELELQEFERQKLEEPKFEKPYPITQELKQTADISPKSLENQVPRTLQSPKPTYLEYQVNLLEIWIDLFQQADITERYKIINFITRKGLTCLISMINKESFNELQKSEYTDLFAETYTSLPTENNNPNNNSNNNQKNHLSNCSLPASQSE